MTKTSLDCLEEYLQKRTFEFNHVQKSLDCSNVNPSNVKAQFGIEGRIVLTNGGCTIDEVDGVFQAETQAAVVYQVTLVSETPPPVEPQPQPQPQPQPRPRPFPKPRPSPTPVKEPVFKFNFDGANAKFKDTAPTPEDVRDAFNIQCKISVTRKDKTFVEVDGEFEPELVPGTYVVAVVKKKKEIPTPKKPPPRTTTSTFKVIIPMNGWERDKEYLLEYPADGKVVMSNMQFNDGPRWIQHADYHVIDRNGTVATSETILEVKENDVFTLLLNPGNNHRDQLQFGQIHRRIVAPVPDNNESLSVARMTMAGRAVFWVMFLDFLSLIKESFVEDVTLTPYDRDKKYTQLICPTSLKSCLHQLTKSVDGYVTRQVSFSNGLFWQKMELKKDAVDTHLTESIQLLDRLKAEILELLDCLSDHLRVNSVNEGTVDLLYGLRGLWEEDRAPVPELSDKNFLWHVSDKVLPVDFTHMTGQRRSINSFFQSADGLLNTDENRIQHLTKFFKNLMEQTSVERAASSLSQKAFSAKVDAASAEDTEENRRFNNSHAGLFAVWKAIGMNTNCVQKKVSEVTLSFVEQDVFRAQNFAEIVFLEFSESIGKESL